MSTTYLLQDVSVPPSPSNSASPAAPSDQPSDHPAASPSTLWCCKYLRRISKRPLLVTAGVQGTVSIWDADSPAEPAHTAKKQSLGIVSLDTDPSPSESKYFITNSLDSKVTRYSAHDAQVEATKALKPGQAWCLAIHPSSEYFAVGGEGGNVTLLQTAVENFGEEIAVLQATGSFALSISFSQDGTLLAVGSNTGTVTLFDTRSHARLSSLPAHTAPIRAVVLSPTLLITGSDDSRINIYDMRSLVSPSHASQSQSQSQQSGPPSSSSSTSSTRRGQIFSLASHTSSITSLSLRSNGRLLASGSSDGQIKIWDLQNPTAAIATLRDHERDVWSVCWQPETVDQSVVEGIKGGFGGGHLASVGEDGKVRWWRGSG